MIPQLEIAPKTLALLGGPHVDSVAYTVQNENDTRKVLFGSLEDDGPIGYGIMTILDSMSKFQPPYAAMLLEDIRDGSS